MYDRIHRTVGPLAVVFAALAAAPAFAPHGWSGYDGDQLLTLTGRDASRTHAGEVRAERIVLGDGTAEKTVELR